MVLISGQGTLPDSILMREEGIVDGLKLVPVDFVTEVRVVGAVRAILRDLVTDVPAVLPTIISVV